MSRSFPSCMLDSSMINAVRETSWPLPAESFSPSLLGYIRCLLRVSMDTDSTATAGRIDFVNAVILEMRGDERE